MSMNYAFGFSSFLLILVALNLYFFYNLTRSTSLKPNFPNFIQSAIHKLDSGSNIHRDIYEHLNHLPDQYKNKNPRFSSIQLNLISLFNTTNLDAANAYDNGKGTSEAFLYPLEYGTPRQILNTMQTSQVVLVNNAPKGTQLKLLLLLEGKQKLFFKPRRYRLNDVIRGSIYAGFDRHNSEVFAYYLSMILNYTWVAPSTIRRLNMNKEVIPVATLGLKKTMISNSSGSVCIYGKCFYCKKNETVCPDGKGEIEGAAILYIEKPFKVYKSPWRRSYSNRKMDWENDDEFCKKVHGILHIKRILNLIDVSIFDFLIQNGDRHRYEVYEEKIVLLDNGKGLGNPTVDELDILAPLYQCCILSMSTWRHLELVSGGVLTDTIKLLSGYQKATLATEEQFKAVERRLLKVYATVRYCIRKYGSSRVFKTLS